MARKIICKDLAQKRFEVEVDDDDSVGDFKRKAAATMTPVPDVSAIKVIFSGKVLADDKKIADAGIKEKDFVVVMVSKLKAAPAAAAPDATSATPPAPAAATGSTAASTPAASTPAPASNDASATPAVASAPAPSDGTGFLTGSALENATSELMNLGFTRPQATRALREAFNNPDRAAENLFSGRYDNVTSDSAAAPAPAGAGAASTPAAAGTGAGAPATPAAATAANPRNLFQQAAQASQAPAAGAAAEAGGDASLPELDQLRSHPMFAQLRNVIQSNPALLQPFLQQLAQSNPQLMQIIARNQDAFLQMLQGDDEEGGDPGAQYIEVSPAEREAIERLTAMGFNRDIVIQAYMACEKNEEMAANYLMEHGQEDEEE